MMYFSRSPVLQRCVNVLRALALTFYAGFCCYAIASATLNPPTGVNAYAASSSQINLSWTAPSGANVKGYNVDRSTSSLFSSVTTFSVSSTTFNDSGLAPSTTYYYRVRATSTSGESAISATVSATTFNTIPAAPSNLQATTASSSQINLTWADNSSNETGFKIERATSSAGPWTLIATTGANVKSYTSQTLNASTTYYFRVRATNSVGDSANSNTAGATTFASAGPTSPTGLTASAVSGAQINLSWNPSTAPSGYVISGYQIFRNGIQIATTSATSYSNTGLSAGMQYCYTISAYDNAGRVSGQSAQSCATTGSSISSVPSSPSNLKATAASTSQMNLTWTDSSSNESGFGIDRASSVLGPWTQIATVGANVTSYSNAGLSSGSWYYYRVWAWNSSGSSAPSAVAAATTPSSATTYTITTSSSPSAGGSTSGGGSKTSGSIATVFAAPNGGYSFVNWTENGAVVSTSSSYGFTVTGNRTLVANFTTASGYTITTSSSPAAGGTTSGGGTKSSGSVVTITATPNAGYAFANWTENGIVVSTSANYSFTVIGSRNLVASFTAATSSGSWAMDIGGTGADMGYAVGRDASGNIFVTGYFSGSVNFGGGALSSAGGQDIFVVKYSPSGTHLWSKRFGGSGDDSAEAVAVDLNGDVVVSGYFSGAAVIGANTFTSNSGKDIFLLKLSGANGAALWAKQIGGLDWSTSTPDDQGYGVATDPRNGDVVLTGQVSGSVYFDGNLVNGNSSPGSFIAKYASNGLYQWSKVFNQTGYDYGKSVAVDASGNILLAGNTRGSINLGGGSLPFGGNSLTYNFYIGKFSSSGVYSWGRCFGGLSGWANSIAVDGQGNVAIVGGFVPGTVDFGGGITISSTGGSQSGFIVKLAGSNGAVSWAKALTTSSFAEGRGAAIDAFGNVILTGYFQGTANPNPAVTLTSVGGYDGLVVKYSGSGGYIWSKRFGGSSSDWGNAVTTDGSGNVIVTGPTNGGDFSGVTLTSNGGFDIFVLKLSP
jgi:hypothetical protein